MTIDSASYTRLKVILEGMTSALTGLDLRIYLLWHGERFKIVEAQIEAACTCERVREYLDEYASSLVAQLELVLPDGPLDEPGQAAIDYMEGLATETRLFAEHIEPKAN